MTTSAITCRRPKARTLAEVIEGADVFLGLSAGGVPKPAMVAKMAAKPVIFALANPNPEISPEDTRCAMTYHGYGPHRLSEPGQQRPVFPYIFRGALDCGATIITDEKSLRCMQSPNSQPSRAARGGSLRGRS
jgi:malate dehydrogenase (oxaloacetate-decarboxylating)(NADP+)